MSNHVMEILGAGDSQDGIMGDGDNEFRRRQSLR